MRWEPRVDGGGGATLERDRGAGRRNAASTARYRPPGPGLWSGLLWRVVCAGEPLAEAERELGWPTRSARLVLAFALDRVADHYRLPG
ncbi:DUF6456 domain-containing protein [Sphingomonas sp. MMS24-JH45]